MYDNYIGEYDFGSQKHFFYPISPAIKDYAISYVLGEVSSSLKEELYHYIDKRFEKLGTCILWDKNPELCQLLAKHGVSIGSKEAIIQRTSVLTTENPKFTPKCTFSI